MPTECSGLYHGNSSYAILKKGLVKNTISLESVLWLLHFYYLGVNFRGNAKIETYSLPNHFWN